MIRWSGGKIVDLYPYTEINKVNMPVRHLLLRSLVVILLSSMITLCNGFSGATNSCTNKVHTPFTTNHYPRTRYYYVRSQQHEMVWGTSQSSSYGGRSKSRFMMIDPTSLMDMTETLSSSIPASSSSSLLLSFTDQGSNLAGIFFQASLIPYLLFLYFLSFRANRLSEVTQFGFQFVLLFVISTIPSGIISKSIYGDSLANTDYLHGGAESLLTLANIIIVLGLREAMTIPKANTKLLEQGRFVGLGAAAIFALSCIVGITFWKDGHTPFLGGIGNIPIDFLQSNYAWITHNEPINALSIPTWMIHFSSVFEYLLAMSLIWQYSTATQNEKWKGLTWGMLPLHASGICACTYHFFYNDPSLQFLVTSQAGLTLLGNITCMIAAYRIAVSNGWKIQNEIPFLPRSKTSPAGLIADGLAAMPLKTSETAVDSTQTLAIKIIILTLLASYGVKYGELAFDLPFTPNVPVAIAMILGFPGLVGLQYYLKSKGDRSNSDNEGQQSLFPTLELPSFMTGGNSDGEAKPSLSMSDVKKYGIAGTVAYVLTELAFWIVAFPVAATALYQSTGHWPDILNDNTDRAAVLAFIFAGANIARAFVPIRLGAALALAPWVDTNLISKLNSNDNINNQEETN